MTHLVSDYSFFIILFRRQIWSCCFEHIITVLLEVWHHCNPPHPPLINYLPPSVSICCRPCSFLLPVTYHIPFICSPPPTMLPEAIFGPYPPPQEFLDHLGLSRGGTNDGGITYISLLSTVSTTQGMFMMMLYSSYIWRSEENTKRFLKLTPPPTRQPPWYTMDWP